jgi:hypothetical protein
MSTATHRRAAPRCEYSTERCKDTPFLDPIFDF